MNTIDQNFINKIEKAHLRTTEDTGANKNTLIVWNEVRKHVGLQPITLEEIPSYCNIHGKYHIIRYEYGCIRAFVNKLQS